MAGIHLSAKDPIPLRVWFGLGFSRQSKKGYNDNNSIGLLAERERALIGNLSVSSNTKILKTQIQIQN